MTARLTEEELNEALEIAQSMHSLRLTAAIAEVRELRAEPQLRALTAAHKKIGEARKIVDEFWATNNAADVDRRETAWAMHVALVRLGEVLKR